MNTQSHCKECNKPCDELHIPEEFPWEFWGQTGVCKAYYVLSSCCKEDVIQKLEEDLDNGHI